jgi:hypothetical protein
MNLLSNNCNNPNNLPGYTPNLYNNILPFPISTRFPLFKGGKKLKTKKKKKKKKKQTLIRKKKYSLTKKRHTQIKKNKNLPTKKKKFKIQKGGFPNLHLNPYNALLNFYYVATGTNTIPSSNPTLGHY